MVVKFSGDDFFRGNGPGERLRRARPALIFFLIGDAMLAYWGAAHDGPLDCGAALEAGKKMLALAAARAWPSGEQFRIAVALHYDKSGAPRVVAKGRGSIGEKIIEIAKAHDIPIEENEVLAGALSNVELGDEIPAELYKAVAEVLVFVLRLSGRIR